MCRVCACARVWVCAVFVCWGAKNELEHTRFLNFQIYTSSVLTTSNGMPQTPITSLGYLEVFWEHRSRISTTTTTDTVTVTACSRVCGNEDDLFARFMLGLINEFRSNWTFILILQRCLHFRPLLTEGHRIVAGTHQQQGHPHHSQGHYSADFGYARGDIIFVAYVLCVLRVRVWGSLQF